MYSMLNVSIYICMATLCFIYTIYNSGVRIMVDSLCPYAYFVVRHPLDKPDWLDEIRAC